MKKRLPNYAVRWDGDKIVYLHFVIMERILGRKLLAHEDVKHVNGNTLDNRRENLQLVERI